ncbi:unnamed protein product [Tetraodon nigroviridis]|uniref:N-alpha-acetyltransferase 35, NatC auxiliary subunit n=1 Tax=Tetraodon nigroviridis TaxID=99883 RepID=Q4RT79_TETNG|nr:unnamed protein product [Tetraodon nigroviridis]
MRLKEGAIKVKDLSFPELIGIIDTCFCCLITWLEGHSLAQTVFTCLYVHNPDLIEEPALKAFALGILKVCDIAREKINKAAVFEEEDFQAMTYGFKMANNVTDLRVTGMLKDVEDELQRKVKSTRSRQGEQRNPEVELEHQQCLALFNRIKFTRLLLTALITFTKKEDFFCEFSEQSPCVLSRSLLQTTFLIDNKKVFGTHLMQDMIKDALRYFVSPPVLSYKCCLFNNHQAKDYIDSFVTHCTRPFCSLIQIHGHNRARQRDKLGHILEEFATLQDEQGDHHESSLPEHVCWHVQGRSSIRPTMDTSSVVLTVTLHHCIPTVCLQTMVALDMDGKVRRPQFELDSEQVRYEHRFAPFNSVVTPPPVHYIQFKEMSDLKKYNPPPGSSDLYLAASKHFQQAKLILENVLSPDPEVNRILKVAKPNIVVTKLLAGGHKKDIKVLPEFDFSAHKYFPVVKII